MPLSILSNSKQYNTQQSIFLGDVTLNVVMLNVVVAPKCTYGISCIHRFGLI
jgi:hypothetical protein